LVIYKIATGKLKKGVLSPYYNNKTYNYEKLKLIHHISWFRANQCEI